MKDCITVSKEILTGIQALHECISETDTCQNPIVKHYACLCLTLVYQEPEHSSTHPSYTYINNCTKIKITCRILSKVYRPTKGDFIYTIFLLKRFFYLGNKKLKRHCWSSQQYRLAMSAPLHRCNSSICSGLERERQREGEREDCEIIRAITIGAGYVYGQTRVIKLWLGTSTRVMPLGSLL